MRRAHLYGGRAAADESGESRASRKVACRGTGTQQRVRGADQTLGAYTHTQKRERQLKGPQLAELQASRKVVLQQVGWVWRGQKRGMSAVDTKRAKPAVAPSERSAVHHTAPRQHHAQHSKHSAPLCPPAPRLHPQCPRSPGSGWRCRGVMGGGQTIQTSEHKQQPGGASAAGVSLHAGAVPVWCPFILTGAPHRRKAWGWRGAGRTSCPRST